MLTRKLKNKFFNLSIASQIGFLIGIATTIFWHFFLIFEFSENFSQKIQTFKTLTLSKIYQFKSDNQHSMISYDYERVRSNVANLDSKIPLTTITITGNFGETIVSSGKDEAINSIYETVDENGFKFVVSKDFNFYYIFDIKFIEPSEQLSESTISGVVKLNSEIKSFVYITFYKYLIVLTLLFFQAILIYLLGKKIASPIRKISKEVYEDKKISLSLGENQEIKHFINSYNSKLIKEHELRIMLHEGEKEIAVANAIAGLAKRVAHDIRSPLAALKVVKEMSEPNLDADVTKLLTMSIDRITDIANTILPKGINENSILSGTESSFIWMLADQIVSEKRVEYKNANNVSIQLEVVGSPFELNAMCNPSEFMRSVSNIINNSIEAKVSDKSIQVDLKLFSNNGMTLLSITDNGKGISPELLSKVFEESFSSGKKQGTGLGLFQVKQSVESWGGHVKIESQVGIGTTIILELKKSQKPQWLADSISIEQYDSMIVLDDEEYVFTILQERFSEHFKNIRYFKRIEEFENHLSHTAKALLFIDHDLKQTATGIDLIQKYQLQGRSILLTGNYDDKQVQQRAVQNNIKILPKPLINDIPVIS